MKSKVDVRDSSRVPSDDDSESGDDKDASTERPRHIVPEMATSTPTKQT